MRAAAAGTAERKRRGEKYSEHLCASTVLERATNHLPLGGGSDIHSFDSRCYSVNVPPAHHPDLTGSKRWGLNPDPGLWDREPPRPTVLGPTTWGSRKSSLWSSSVSLASAQSCSPYLWRKGRS